MDAISGTRRQVLLGLYLAGGWLPGARAQTAGCSVNIPGLAVGCVLGTLALCLIAFGIYFLVSRKKAKKRKALQVAAGGPGDLESGFPEGRGHPSHAYVIENPHTKDEQKNGSQKTKAAAAPPVGTTTRDVSTEEAVPGDDSYLVLLDKKEEDQSSGFNIMKGDNGKIFIQDVRQGGPAWKSGKIHDGDQLVSVTVYFTDIAYEDALTILSYSSPYKVQLRLRKPSKRPSPVAKTVPVTIEMQPVPAASSETQQDAAKVLQPTQAAAVEQEPAVAAETQRDAVRMELQQQQPVHEPEVLETLEPLPSPEDRLPQVWGVEVDGDDGGLSERKHKAVVDEANRIVDDAFESAKEELRREEKLLREDTQQSDMEKPLTPRLERRLSSTSLPGAFPEEATWKSPNPYPSNLPEIKFTGQSKSLDHLNKSVASNLPDDMRPRSLADIDFSKYIPPPTEPPPPMTPDTPKPIPPERGSAKKKRKAPPPPSVTPSPPTVSPSPPTVSPPTVSPPTVSPPTVSPPTVSPPTVSPPSVTPPPSVSPPPTSVSPPPPSVSPPALSESPPPTTVSPPSVSPIAKKIPSELLTNVTVEKEEDRRKDELTDSGLELSISTPNQEVAPALLPPPPPAVLQTHASQDSRAPDNPQEEKSTSPSGDSGINVDIGTVEPPLLSPPVVPTILPGKESILEQKIEEQAQESAREFQNFLDSQPEKSLLPAAPAPPVLPTPLEEDQVIPEEKEKPERSRYSPSALTQPFTLPPVDLYQTPTEEIILSSSSESESEPDDSKYKNIRVDEVDKKRSSMSSEPPGPEEERPGSTEGVFLATMVSVASSEESSSEDEAESQVVTMSPPSAKQLRDQFFNDMKPTSGLENNIMSPETHPVNNTEEIHEPRTPSKQRASSESSENLLDSIGQQQAILEDQAGTSSPSLVDQSKTDSRGGLQGVNGTPEGSFMV
ncbi:PREDICTED: nascent polypeptide-associated complex subunit alpha, muscle-specific form-like [Branchiostoma belcheri]|uniref:Nascent polypeptide-associated complex subunit alpha, muscle-specific form-like n=2 Tax=Branchiostoma TaxID=7737 RepID=A0A6P5A3V2_BRABE|nr:PREDICTED: nascent polypeptide-associated complex subunit alpha, muscle-specific form-like [Branchiostoma belcheri]